MNFEEQRKKVYDESVSLIADLGFRQRISFEEMNFLLSLLDMVFVHKNNPGLTAVLRRWIQDYDDSENDAIIKATLIAADLNDQESVEQCVQAITELMEDRT